MKTVEEEKALQELRWLRLAEQKRNNDYDYATNNERERCGTCGSYLNSHRHCPVCYY